MTRIATLAAAALLAGLAAAQAATAPESPLALGPGPDWCAAAPKTSAEMLTGDQAEAPKAPACRRVAEEV